MWRRLLLVTILLVCTACASAVSGVPAPDPTLPRIPARPQELRVTGLDPCRTLAVDQLRSLKVGFYTTDPPLHGRGPECTWIHSPYEPIESYSVAVNTDGGVEVTFGQPQLHVITVAGFGAVEVPALPGTGKNDCIVLVDVASRQALEISYFYNGSTVPMTHEIACGKARNAAELAMRTVLAELGG